jgi:glycine hydroxymethyltransferase
MEALHRTDPQIAALIEAEARDQASTIRLIPSENYTSKAVLEASGSVLCNKYSEGYPGKRYYEGQTQIDAVETLCVERAKALFGAEAANVQPYSGSPANLAVYAAFLAPGDTILGMALPHGGHLTHGWKVSYTGIWFNAVQYGVERDSGRIDYAQMRALAREHKPKIIVCGASAYPRIIDFAPFAEAAQEVGAVLLADIAHISGLVAGGVHPSPVPFADVVTTTTHKTLRGPRGGMILSRAQHEKTLQRAVFPGLQGGPHNHTTAGIAVALGLALRPEFREYAQQVVRNAKALAVGLEAQGFRLVSGGTDNHLILMDTTAKGAPGKPVASALARAGIETNANSIPYDPRSPFDPSGVRLGSPAVTSRGMKEPEMAQIAAWIGRVVDNLTDDAEIGRVRAEVEEFCQDFPAPGIRE